MKNNSYMSIEVLNKYGDIKASSDGENQVILAFSGEYEEGDKIKIKVPLENCYYVIRIDGTMDEALVYLSQREIIYSIPFFEKKKSYNPNAFCGERHYLTCRKAESFEFNIYRNLAKNVIDQHESCGCFPHAYANVETRGESVFAARNAIDGIVANRSHGSWPYQSWGINKQLDAWFCLNFGRGVDFDRIILWTRADFPHDNWWTELRITFSDGTSQILEMQKSEEPHVFHIHKNNITWIKLDQLIQADDPSPFPALTQIEVYGKETQI